MTEEEKKDVVEEATEETTEDAAPAEEVKEEEKKEDEAPAADDSADAAEEEVEVPAEYKDLIEKIENMSVIELHGLVKVLEKKFGVSAAAVAVAGGAAGGDAGGEEKDAFEVVLSDVGGQKIAVIKAVKEVLGLGLKEAKDMVESAPATLKSDVKKEEAEEWKAKFEEAGAKVELK